MATVVDSVRAKTRALCAPVFLKLINTENGALRASPPAYSSVAAPSGNTNVIGTVWRKRREKFKFKRKSAKLIQLLF